MKEDLWGSAVNDSGRAAATSPDEPTVAPWARQPSVAVARKTNRSRRIVSTLPSWDPLPPGEILVRRPDHG